MTAFTAKQIADVLGITSRSVRKYLLRVSPDGALIVSGQEAAAWTIARLPESLRQRLETEAVRQRCKGASDEQQIETLLAMPRQRYKPEIALDKISDADISAATKLRESLRPWLIRQHDSSLSSSELDAAGVEDYRRQFGNAVTTRYWRELFTRTIQRDNGFEEWNRLEIYLPDRLKLKDTPTAAVSAALADDFEDLENFIATCANPHNPSDPERVGLWTLAFSKFAELVRAGQTAKSASRRVRQFLFFRAQFLAPTRNALRMAFERKLDQWQRDNPDSLADGRRGNGDRAEYPREDVHCLRHSAVFKNGGRIDSAWREEWPRLSDYTRQRHPRSRKCPRALYQLVNRVKVDALCARLQGRRALRKIVGSVTRNTDGIHAMDRFVADDWTSNVEIAYTNRDGSISLLQPQIITVMDFASRKWVGWAMSTDGGPTVELVCEAILDAFRRHGVPRKLCLENGWVFGRSLNVNGKVDDEGRTLVAGLAQYGCTISHFDKMSPTSKGELEKSFDIFQRQMERHPGYAGRLQILDAADSFKKEQRLIRAGKVDATKYRYTFDGFVCVMRDLIAQYNATPQYGHLKGVSPDEAFEALKDPADPPIHFNNELYWMLANERYRVQVTAGGVVFRHYGRKIQVRGGELPQYAGQELWALVERGDDSLVTFMTPDYCRTFTVETCQQPSADEKRMVSGSSVLAGELKKISQHMRAVDDELKDLAGEFGNPRADLLAKYNREAAARPGGAVAATRATIINPALADSAQQMQTQRETLRAQQKKSQNSQRLARRFSESTGVVLSKPAQENLQPDEARFLADYLKGNLKKDAQ